MNHYENINIHLLINFTCRYFWQLPVIINSYDVNCHIAPFTIYIGWCFSKLHWHETHKSMLRVGNIFCRSNALWYSGNNILLEKNKDRIWPMPLLFKLLRISTSNIAVELSIMSVISLGVASIQLCPWSISVNSYYTVTVYIRTNPCQQI